jgi:hypothetical protein
MEERGQEVRPPVLKCGKSQSNSHVITFTVTNANTNSDVTEGCKFCFSSFEFT